MCKTMKKYDKVDAYVPYPIQYSSEDQDPIHYSPMVLHDRRRAIAYTASGPYDRLPRMKRMMVVFSHE